MRINIILLAAFAITSTRAAELKFPQLTIPPGKTGTAEIRFTGQGAAVAGMQFEIAYDPALSLDLQVGSAASIAGKSLSTSRPSSGVVRILIAGLNQTPISDGVVAGLTVSVGALASGSYSLRCGNMSAADKDGRQIPVACVDGQVATSSGNGGTGLDLPQRGSLPQIASGQEWKTQVYVTNLDSTSAPVRLLIRGNDGKDLALAWRTGGSSSGYGETNVVSLTVPAGGVAMAETESTKPIAVGWAEVQSTANVAAYAVFRQKLRDGVYSEAVVSMDSSSGSARQFAFDNSNGYVTGLALSNVSKTERAIIRCIVRDQGGSTLSQDDVPLDPSGHTSFVIQEKFPSSSGKLGTLVIQSNVAISALGLRFSPFQSFTSVPVINAP